MQEWKRDRESAACLDKPTFNQPGNGRMCLAVLGGNRRRQWQVPHQGLELIYSSSQLGWRGESADRSPSWRHQPRRIASASVYRLGYVWLFGAVCTFFRIASLILLFQITYQYYQTLPRSWVERIFKILQLCVRLYLVCRVGPRY